MKYIPKHTTLHSEQSKRKMSETRKLGILNGTIKIWNKGISPTEETRIKMGSGRRGKKWTPEMREKIMSKLPRGEHNHFYKQSNSGEKHPRWIKDRTQLCRISKQGERRTSAYFYWRKQVWLRDNFKCKIGNPDCTGRIEAHHILPWRDHAELRYEVNNGITLCAFHHPRGYEEEKRLAPQFFELVSVSK